MGFPELFEKKLLAQFISYLAFILMGWVSRPLYIFMFLASFSALWWPNIWPKMGFPELFEKTIGSIHFIPGVYPYGLSFLTPIHFRVPSLIFSPLVAKYLAENGVSGTFWKNYWFHSLHTWHLSIGGESLDPYTFSLVAKYLAEKGFFVQNRNLCWMFLDEVGSDQSGGILSPFWGTACLYLFWHYFCPS